MCRTKDIGGIALAHFTLLLILYGQYIANRCNIFYWHLEKNVDEQWIQGIPLTFKGLVYCTVFNGFCFMAYISHIRAAFSDPGRITEGMTPPFQSEYMEMKNCEKCTGKETWKPMRAHHCSECGFCVFKMDHHCPWVNNCVGHRNMKYFLQFVLYIMLSSVMLCLLCVMSFYNLLTSKNTRIHMNHGNYPYAFIGSILAFVEGLLFAYFTFDLMSEQITSIDDNQSYVDDLKKQYGKQQDWIENAKLALGIDFLWWLVPTRPELRTNFYERVWPKREIKRMYKNDQFDMEEEDSDPDKKLFALEQRKSQFEKKVFWLLLLVGLLLWIFLLQEPLVEKGLADWGWAHGPVEEPVTSSRRGRKY